MRDDPKPLDPLVALGAIQVLAQGALDNEEPTLHGWELILREILRDCDLALPSKARPLRTRKPD
ncbi:hypothetical protein [Methylobacterium sp. E-046]|uniref:hypothetical protein n=1 Tax=Methylobacterium sp. E-046 TaxID=2836576 RepID=UPI001FB8E7C9|nr:hypothetical protein [Methylobacterium sp. E-046]MCJ2101226.1 hypothetical protein [Methylobacterium sp. E-046]